MTEEEFFKKVGIYSRYLAQFLNEGDVPKVLDAIKELEKLRQQAETEKVA
jgi:nitrate reductase beta subunit